MVKDSIFDIRNSDEFSQTALSVFQRQVKENPVYRSYAELLRIHSEKVKTVRDIPFLPISFFKTRKVKTGEYEPVMTFTSSGTTGRNNSRHFVRDLTLYRQSFLRGFERSYGSPNDYCIIGLLPSYRERSGSSLIYMVDELMKASGHPQNGYFLYNHEELHTLLLQLKNTGQKTMLIGVSFALLDFTESHRIDFPELIVMETGGMKGRRKELIRSELHSRLKAGFGVANIHSEYGMTELMSQAYSGGGGLYTCPPWMKVWTRDVQDPLTLLDPGKTGGLNIIDLANRDSCAFIATEDLGRVTTENKFEVLGRFDQAEVRGCNLMVAGPNQMTIKKID